MFTEKPKRKRRPASHVVSWLVIASLIASLLTGIVLSQMAHATTVLRHDLMLRQPDMLYHDTARPQHLDLRESDMAAPFRP